MSARIGSCLGVFVFVRRGAASVKAGKNQLWVASDRRVAGTDARPAATPLVRSESFHAIRLENLELAGAG